MGDPLDFAVITALVLAATLGLGPRIRTVLRPHARRVQSFGGGVGVAYIFLSLFPEIENVHAWLGRHVHLVTLLSFLLFFALEAWLIDHARLRREAGAAASAQPVEPPVFWLHVAIMAFYTAVVMFALPEAVAGELLLAVAAGLAIGSHLVYKDYLLRAEAGDQFQASGRVLLAAAPLLGWVLHRIAEPSEAVLDISMAVLAGILMQSVFRDELPRPDRAALAWMVTGVAAYAVLSLFT